MEVLLSWTCSQGPSVILNLNLFLPLSTCYLIISLFTDKRNDGSRAPGYREPKALHKTNLIMSAVRGATDPPVGPLGVTVTQAKDGCLVLKIMMDMYFKKKIQNRTGAPSNQGYRWICMREFSRRDAAGKGAFIFHRGFVVHLVWSLQNST